MKLLAAFIGYAAFIYLLGDFLHNGMNDWPRKNRRLPPPSKDCERPGAEFVGWRKS